MFDHVPGATDVGDPLIARLAFDDQVALKIQLVESVNKASLMAIPVKVTLARLALALGTLLSGGLPLVGEEEERLAVSGGPGLTGTAVAFLRDHVPPRMTRMKATAESVESDQPLLVNFAYLRFVLVAS